MFNIDRAVKLRTVTADQALAGRDYRPYPLAGTHTVLGTPIEGAVPSGHEEIVLGMGCFWGVERIFWQLPGVWTTAAAYAGGHTPNPTYEEVCSGLTGHTEAVRVVYDPAVLSQDELFKAFWEGHDPTQGMRQGNDIGTQYRSAIYVTTEAQRAAAERTRDVYAARLAEAGYGPITTEIGPLRDLWYAEDYHQQYLSDAKNPHGYCGVGGTGVSCPVGVL